jgi:hypothetical protein
VSFFSTSRRHVIAESNDFLDSINYSSNHSSFHFD